MRIINNKVTNEYILPSDPNLVRKLKEKEMKHQIKVGKTFKITHKVCQRVYWFATEPTEKLYEEVHKNCICNDDKIHRDALKNNIFIDVCELGHSFTTTEATMFHKKMGMITNVTLEKTSRKCKKCLEIWKMTFTTPEELRLKKEADEKALKLAREKIKYQDEVARALAGVKYGFKS